MWEKPDLDDKYHLSFKNSRILQNLPMNPKKILSYPYSGVKLVANSCGQLDQEQPIGVLTSEPFLNFISTKN